MVKKEDIKILVIGIGNDLLSDEGVGIHAIRELQKEPWPPNVTVYNGGVLGIDLLSLIQDHDKLVIVDAVNAQAEPGAVFRFRPEEVDCLLRNSKTSLHQIDIIDTIKIARFMGKSPEIVIIGVQPKTITWGLSLSPELLEKLPRVLKLVRDEISRILE